MLLNGLSLKASSLKLSESRDESRGSRSDASTLY